MKGSKKVAPPVTLLAPINESASNMSWSRSGNSSSIEELNARGYKHFKGRRRSIGSQIKLMILEEEKREQGAASGNSSGGENADMETASGGVSKFLRQKKRGNDERSTSPPPVYDRNSFTKLDGYSRMFHTSGRKAPLPKVKVMKQTSDEYYNFSDSKANDAKTIEVVAEQDKDKEDDT